MTGWRLGYRHHAPAAGRKAGPAAHPLDRLHGDLYPVRRAGGAHRPARRRGRGGGRPFAAAATASSPG